MRYNCDTLGGNSGSPIFDAETGMVIGIHSGGYCDFNDDIVNQNVNQGSLISDPEILQALQDVGVPIETELKHIIEDHYDAPEEGEW